MGTRTRVNENEGGTYQVRTGSELAGVVSEWVLTRLVFSLGLASLKLRRA